MFFRETELRAARSCARVQPSKRADGAGKICVHPKALKRRCGLVGLPALDLFQPFISAAAWMSVCEWKHPSPEDTLRTAGGQGFNFILKLAALVITVSRTLQNLDGEVRGVNTHPASRRPTQAWNVMGKRCPGDVAAKGAANPQPMPAQLHLGPETHTQLHAHMYQKHLDITRKHIREASGQWALARPLTDGRGSQQPEFFWKYVLIQVDSWEKKEEIAPLEGRPE